MKASGRWSTSRAATRFWRKVEADRAQSDYETALHMKPTSHEIAVLKGEALSMLGCYMRCSKPSTRP